MIRFLSTKDKQQVKLAWKTIATDLSLTYREADHPVLSGNWENHSVEIKMYKEPGGRGSQVLTSFEICHRHDFHTSFQLSQQGLFQSMIEMVGAKDIQVGDPAFDDKILVKGWDKKAVQRLLEDDRVRSACLNIVTHFRYTNVRITNQKISGSVAGMVMNPSEIQTILRHFLKVALLLKEVGIRIDRKEANAAGLPDDLLEVASPVEPAIESPAEELVPDSSRQSEEPPLVEKKHSPPSTNRHLFEIAEQLLGTAQAENRFNDLLQGKKIEGTQQLSYIIPAGNDPVFERDSGWVATMDPLIFPGLPSLQVKYRIGLHLKESIDREARSQLDFEGTLVYFELSTNTLYIDSGDAREKAGVHSATVVVSI